MVNEKILIIYNSAITCICEMASTFQEEHPFFSEGPFLVPLPLGDVGNTFASRSDANVHNIVNDFAHKPKYLCIVW